MSGNPPQRIFISYSRKDGAEAAGKLRAKLGAQGFSIWQDLTALEPGPDWWSQIEAALKSKTLQHFVLIVTPGALASPVVRREIRLARQEGKTFLPVKGPGLGALHGLPRWIGQLADLDIPEHRRTLNGILEGPSKSARMPMMAPEPPADFVPRRAEFEALKAQLLHPETHDAVAITAALRGAGGYGKTTLARALAHDEDIKDAYFDGVLWGELGEQGGARFLLLISDLVALLEGQPRAMATREAARTALGEALGDRRILLVIDDVWKHADLEPFLHGGRNTTRLITTRFDKELPETAVRQQVDAMRPHEARALLASGLPAELARAHGAALDALAGQLHDWAQLLKLANGFLRDRVVKYHQPLAAAIDEAEKRLAAKGLPAFDASTAVGYANRHKSVAAAISINLDLLDAEKRARFSELGVFPEDEDVPVGIVARLWAGGGAPDEFATLDLLAELYDLSLLLNLDLERRTIRFHDTTRHYLLDEAKKRGSLVGLHKRLAEAIKVLGSHAPDPSADDIVYYYRHLPAHLDAACQRDALDAILLSPEWLNNKLVALGNPQTLIANYQQFARGATQVIIGRTLQLISSICARDPRQILPQLIGRLMILPGAELSSFLAQARKTMRLPALVPQYPGLTSAGAETTRLEGHRRGVHTMVMLPDGRLASASGDGTIRLWDICSGAETARFEAAYKREGHTDEGDTAMVFSSERERNLERYYSEVQALAVLSDGRLASGSADGTIRLWDVLSGTATKFEGHRYGISALAALPDGRLASCSREGTIRLWDVASGAQSAEFGHYEKCVNVLAVLPDGRLASASDDGAIRLWDVGSGTETTLEGLKDTVQVLAVLPDGRLASSGREGIWLWDVRAAARPVQLARDWGHALAPLSEGRLAWISGTQIKIWSLDGSIATTQLEWTVKSLLTLPDGRLASGGSEGTIRLWDTRGTSATAWQESYRWTRDAKRRALAALQDSRIAVGSRDGVELWDASSAAEIGQIPCDRRVDALAILPDGRLAMGLQDGIRLWDPGSGTQAGRIECRAIDELVALPDGRLAALSDAFIQVWDIRSGDLTLSFKKQDRDHGGLAALPDGRLAAAGRYGIQLWAPGTGAETARFATDFAVTALAVLPDNRLIAGLSGGTISLLDVGSGSTTRLECDGGSVFNLAVLPNGRFACGSGKEVRLWDAASGRELARLDLDFDVRGLLSLPDGRLLVSDMFCRLHWLEIFG